MTYLLLGRTGDLISILPFLKAEADAGEKPTLIVSNQHTSVLEGVSFVNVVPFDGGIQLLRQAWDWARAQYPGVKSLQIVGPTKDVDEITFRPSGFTRNSFTTSFDLEPWRLAGKLNESLRGYPLVFDQRNPERETKLLEDVGLVRRPGQGGRPRKEKRVILVSAKGNSSPFPYADLLLELLRLKFEKGYYVVELPQAERIYDLLALYERAHCLVTTDSAPLHLAQAVPELPVIALTNDQAPQWIIDEFRRSLPTLPSIPAMLNEHIYRLLSTSSMALWNGSSWHPQWAWCCRYHDWPERTTEMLNAIAGCRSESTQPWIEVWNNYDLAHPPSAYHRRLLPVFPGACGRDSANVLKDPQRIPYLKDCLRMGMQRVQREGLVILRRPDTRLTESPAFLEGACFAYRLTRNGSGDTFSPIVDFFCAEKQWWKSHLKEIPDLLLGSDYQWSEALRVLFQKHGGKDVTGVCYMEAKKV